MNWNPIQRKVAHMHVLYMMLCWLNKPFGIQRGKKKATHTGSTYCMYALLIKLDKSISKIGYFVLLLLLPNYSLNIHVFSVFIYWFHCFFISILNTGKYIFIWFLNFCHVLFWSSTGYKIMVQLNDGPQRNKDMVQIKMDKHISTLMCV